MALTIFEPSDCGKIGLKIRAQKWSEERYKAILESLTEEEIERLKRLKMTEMVLYENMKFALIKTTELQNELSIKYSAFIHAETIDLDNAVRCFEDIKKIDRVRAELDNMLFLMGDDNDD